MQIDVTPKRARQMARTLKTFLEQEGSGRFKHVNALEAIARVLGWRNHNAMLAALEAEPAETVYPRPSAAFQLPVALYDPHDGSYVPEAAVAEIHLADILAGGRPAIDRLLAAYRSEMKLGGPAPGRENERGLFDGHPDYDRLRAVMWGAARPRVGILVEEIGQALEDGLAGRAFHQDALVLDQLSDAEARKLAARLRPAPRPLPPKEFGVVAVQLDDDPRAPTYKHAVVVFRDGRWERYGDFPDSDHARSVAAMLNARVQSGG